MAASCPCATAQMMFLGPNAASPPKKTPGRVAASVTLSTTGMSHSSKAEAEIALDPRERVLLPDGHQHVVAREVHVGLAGGHELPAPALVALRRHLLEGDAGELAALVRDRLRHQEVVDGDALVRGVLLLPRRRLHLVEAGAHHHVHVLPAQPARAAAAVHRGVAPAQHHHAAGRRASCGRTTRSRASRCRCGCWRRPRRGRERRCRGRAARRCRRTRRRSPAPAAPACCRCAARRGTRRRGRGCSPPPRR